jgi:hypothetical protein
MRISMRFTLGGVTLFNVMIIKYLIMLKVDKDVLIVSKYETAMQLAGNFLTVFLNKCGSKNEEIDYRPLFENFVQDLLTTVNKPEWPSAELLLSLLGKILVSCLFFTIDLPSISI